MATYPTDQDIDATFPDNDTGEIGADDMRAFQKSMTAAGIDYAAMTENVPTSFPPSAHTHETDEVTGLDATLQGLTNQLNGYTLAVVSSLPGTPDANTIYFVTT